MPTTDVHHGFERMDDRQVPELDARVVRYRHRKTGADFLSLQNDDENKVFGITFRTVPSDSTGVAHILEHSVLCGSEKYPVKEPFVELLKGSLQTFLNAFTFPDKTCYPVASPHPGDLYNLMDVYLDAVFHPRLNPLVLQQEGWHLHQPAPDAPLTIQGVVYNEMKGVYSSPDALLGEALQQSLFPDTPYGLDSGGDPRHIPDLTWDAFSAFHRRNYHPSNALIFMAGDDDPTERLRRLDAVLSGFDAAPVEADFPIQAPFEEPRRVRRPFCAESDEPDAERGLAAVCWGLPDPLDPVRMLTFEVLAHILFGTSASPLRKALIDSDLGEGLAGTGLETQLRQMYLAAGLRGIRPEDTERMEAVIFETLEDLVSKGLDRTLIEASLNTVEFVLREQNTGAFPRGLARMLRALPGWQHGADPIDHIAFEKTLHALKTAASERGFFEALIDRHLLRNTHRAMLTLDPDPDMARRLAAEEQERIDRLRSTLSPEDKGRMVEQTLALQAAQDRPDSPEDLARIPTLSVEDLPRENRPTPGKTEDGALPFFLHPLPTRGIVYLDLAFDLRGVRTEWLPLVPVFSRALFETGTAREDFVSLSRRIGRDTGGLGATAITPARLDDGRVSPWLRIGGKALAPRMSAMFDILRDVFQDAHIDDRTRVPQLLREAKASAEASLIQAGHSYVAQRLSAQWEEPAWLTERMSGIEALFALRSWAKRAESDPDSVGAELVALRGALLRRTAAWAGLTADPDDVAQACSEVSDVVARLPEGASAVSDWAPDATRVHEALTLPAQVHYVGLGGNMFSAGYRYHGSARVASRLLSTGWLWERVRVQGGAYGAFFRLSRATGVFTFVSYRDPQVAGTLDVYRNAADWLRRAAGDHELRKRAILGTIGDMDAPELPDAKGRTATIRRLTGDTDERRARLREDVLGTTEADLRDFAEALDSAVSGGSVCVLGNAESLRGLAETAGGPVREVKVL